jgi:hydrogenase maturation protease
LKEEMPLKTTLILGVGNVVMGDEGFGVHVARKLEENELPPGVRVEEGGVGGFNLLGTLGDIQRVIVVDVMMMDLPPGDICLFKPGPDFRGPEKNIVSFHQIGVLELVQMWGLIGKEPEVFYLVTCPERLEWSMELTPPVAIAVEKAVDLLDEICNDSFAALERSAG